MTFNFFALNEFSPSLTFSCSGDGLYDAMCEFIVNHVLGADPYSEAAARDLVEIVAMQTPDEAEYVEAVYVQGKLVGSMDAPFEVDPAQYVKI